MLPELSYFTLKFYENIPIKMPSIDNCKDSDGFLFNLVILASYGMQHPIGMGRGFPGYGAMGPGSAAAAPTPGYAGTPGPSPYGYGMYRFSMTCSLSWPTANR